MDGFESLGLGKYTSLLKDVQIKHWGKTVLIDCIYDPDKRLPYRIKFSDCEEIKWFFDEDQVDCIDSENILDILDFQIEDTSNRKKVLIFALVTELIIDCKNIKLEKDWYLTAD